MQVHIFEHDIEKFSTAHDGGKFPTSSLYIHTRAHSSVCIFLTAGQAAEMRKALEVIYPTAVASTTNDEVPIAHIDAQAEAAADAANEMHDALSIYGNG